MTSFGQSDRVVGALGDDVAVSGEFKSAAPSQAVTSQRASGCYTELFCANLERKGFETV